jgi:hypothetical protein
MYFNPPQPENNPANPFWHPLNQQQEAVSVELEFKSDAAGKKAGGKKVGKNTYMMTFKDNKEMNKFMDTHSDKLNESTAEYRAMMKKYKGSDAEKVFKMLRDEGFKVGEQDDTLVRNLLKRHKGNVKKVVDQIVKDYPGKFDVNRMMMDHVEIDEESQIFYKRPASISALGGQKNHAIVDGRGMIIAVGFTEKDAKKKKKFGQKVMELPGARIGQKIKMFKEDVEQVDELFMKKALAGEKAREVLTDAKIPHSMVMGRIRVPERFVTIAKKTLDDAFGGMFQKKTGFKVSGTMKEDVQLDEMSAKAHYNKMKAQGKLGGMVVTPIDRDRFPNREKEGLEGPFRSKKSGQVYYYDRKAGKYYDPLSDMFLQVKDVMESINEQYAMMTNIDWHLNDLTWSTIIIPNTFDGVQSGEYNSAFDWNGDGVLDMDDVLLAMDLWQQGLGVMYADDYQRMLADMEAGRRSNVNKGGAQMQIGTRFGSKTSRPPAAPPTTGSMRESVQLEEEFGPETYESAMGAIQSILYMYNNPKFDPKVYFANNESGQLFVSLYDYNGDGLVDFDDLTLLLSLQSAGLPFMYAFTYNKYMESDARSGAKQQRGTQLQIGKTMGSKTSRPPAAPPTTGSMRESVQLDEEDRDPRFASQQNAIQLFMQSVIDNPDFDFESFYQDETGQYFLSLYDYNGDGVIDFGDLQVLLSLEGAGLPYMDAADYIRYMGSGARSGVKQQRGSQIQIGTQMGSKTSKPPAAPADTSTGAGGR